MPTISEDKQFWHLACELRDLSFNFHWALHVLTRETSPEDAEKVDRLAHTARARYHSLQKLMAEFERRLDP